MNRAWYWRLGLVLTVTVAAFVVLWPSIPRLSTPWVRQHIPFRLNEGLDIRGGARLSYDVQIGQAITDRRNRVMEDLREQLASDYNIHRGQGHMSPDELTRLSEKVTLAVGLTNRQFIVRFRAASDASKINDALMRRLGVARINASGGTLTFNLREDEVTRFEASAVQQAVETITNRVDELAVKETSVTARGETIVVEVPGQDEAYFNQIREVIRRTARLEFKILDDGNNLLEDIIERGGPAPPTASPEPTPTPTPTRTPRPLPAGITLERENAHAGPGRNVVALFLRSTGDNARQNLATYLTSIQSLVPDGRQLLMGKATRETTDVGTPRGEIWRTYLVVSIAQIDGSMISDASVGTDQDTNQPYVALTFNGRGAQIFARVTEENVKKRFAIVLDDRVNSAPEILARIGGGNARITLGGDQDLMREAQELVVVLRAGALPAPLTEGQQSYVGATLGSDTITSARNAMIVGIALVLGFMAFYYGWAGFIANGAVLLNLLIQLGALALFGAAITLPGLAGLALTVGMSVDNNVLINERIREERRSGKTIRAAVDAGYNHAFTAIFDGHVTTLISGVVLLQYGTGPVKGFAVTLLIGVIANLFTGVFATRVVFDWLVKGLRVKTLLGG